MSIARQLIRDILAAPPIGREAHVAGWVRTRRDSKAGVSFIELNDGSCFRNLQVVAPQELPNYQREVLRLHPGCSIEAYGAIVESPGRGQTVELQATRIDVLGYADPQEYPLGKQRVSFERLREIAHLRPRTNTFGAVARVRNVLAIETHRFFQERAFYYVHSPIITPSDCEGAGAMFRVTTLDPTNPASAGRPRPSWRDDFFGRPAFLTVSGQLEAEAYACSLGRVYTFGPTFRAEDSNTRRHLAEFWMVEPELAFADLEDDVALAADYIRHLCRSVLEQCPAEVDFFERRIAAGLRKRLESTAERHVPVITYTEAVERLQRANRTFEFPPEWGNDLQSEHERFLTDEVFGGAVAVIDYPRSIKPFYMRVNDDGRTVAAVDVFLPEIGEIVGGSQREERLDVLQLRMQETGLDPDRYWWYSDLRRFGAVPHAGFGLGFERMVLYCTGLSNIRDAIPFPRTPRSLEF